MGFRGAEDLSRCIGGPRECNRGVGGSIRKSEAPSSGGMTGMVGMVKVRGRPRPFFSFGSTGDGIWYSEAVSALKDTTECLESL
jgi:hypothetical protein